MCVCVCVRACASMCMHVGGRGWLCVFIYEGWVQVVCNGYGDKLGAAGMDCWGVCVCVRMCLFSENWRALKQALGNQKRI